jgi:hypothetical protein
MAEGTGGFVHADHFLTTDFLSAKLERKKIDRFFVFW